MFQQGTPGEPAVIYTDQTFMAAWVTHLGRERFGILPKGRILRTGGIKNYMTV